MANYDSFRAARWIRFINLVLQAVLFLSLFTGLNYLALNHSWRFDLTESQRHSLSPETRSYLEQLNRNVQIVVTISNERNAETDQAFRDISGLLREYSHHTRNSPKGRIDVRYLDIYQNRKEAESLHLDKPDQVVLICGDHDRSVLTLDDFYQTRERRREGFKGESTLTAALLGVSNPEKKKIYFLAGHGEMRPDDVDRRRGLSTIRDQLRARNYEVASVDLSLSRKIPDDAALIIVASPQGRLQAFEEELLRKYLSTRAGRLFLLLDYGVQHGLENLLFDWGIIVQDNVIIDPDENSITEASEMRLWSFGRDPDSHITDNLLDNGMSLIVGPTRSVSGGPGRTLDDGLRVKTLVTSSPAAWGESSYRIPGSRFEYTPGQDLKGELGVMVISERLKPANLNFSVKGGRLAVIGTADLVTNDRIITVGNLSLFLATVNWAVQDKDVLVNIPVRPIERFQLALSAEEFVSLRLGLLLLVPGGVALLGLAVYWTRRN